MVTPVTVTAEVEEKKASKKGVHILCVVEIGRDNKIAPITINEA